MLLSFSKLLEKLVKYPVKYPADVKVKSAEDFIGGLFTDACDFFFSDYIIKAYVVGTHLNCLNLLRQFK